jgi:hypothetical protein
MKSKRMSILPKSLNNEYHGHFISKHTFLIITVASIIRSLIHIFAADGGAQSIATIPLENYSIEAASTIIMMFALWGISQLLMGIVFAYVYIKVKSLIPAMYVLLILEYSMRILVGIMKPIITVETAPGAYGNFIMVPLSILMLYLSLRNSKSISSKSV